ncbi:glycosyltransferase family 2 protein [Phycicoccus sp. M110.8]|uniref:glycosyltransferase family 2 protein n=1 Tax=Phycicoccus sp. M110.8 TaxID=3075433 RepID=UPI0028FD05E7|nr:glycosyltransferase family 2 protein [Phycicoccus sp. M110.8]MDU0312714.1 glycosyltransferase family 2 protein [Phycicoccus sp. M110.8]
MTRPVSVIVLGYGTEDLLESCLESIASQLPVDGELLLVDNGIARASERRSRWPGIVRVLGDGSENTGFAGGCLVAAEQAQGEVLVFLNSDAILREEALDRLVTAAAAPGAGIVCGCLRLAQEPDLVNSVGNPLQFLGLTWAGECGSPASEHTDAHEVPVATGGFFALSRAVWDAVGAFDPTYFAYHEDTDLSVRAWLSGRTVRVLPDAVADHHYEFSRNPFKMYLLERNRFILVLTTYPTALLRRVLPVLVLLEPAFFLLSVLQGWPRQKLQAWWWLANNTAYLRRRRAEVQALSTGPDATARLAALMTAAIDPPNVPQPPGMGVLNAFLRGYWVLARPRRRG